MKKYLLLFIAFVCSLTCFAQQESTTPVSRQHIKWWKNRFVENSQKSKEGNYDIVFIGDSITDFWRNTGSKEFQAYFSKYKTLNLGYSADRTEHVLWRLQNGEFDGANPKLIVLMIGTNNTGHRFKKETARDTADGIQAIIQLLRQKSPQSKILLFGIFPRAELVNDQLRQRNREVNKIISKYADNKHIFYLDINQKFLNKDFSLPKKIMPDLLHPNAAGYQIWAEAIIPYVKQIVDVSTFPQPRSGWWMQRHKQKCNLAQAEQWDYIFLGDSITHGWENVGAKVWEEYFAPYKILNLGFSGDCTGHVLWRLDNGEFANQKPKKVFLMIGTNNTGLYPEVQQRPEDTAKGIKAIIENIQQKSPTTQIVLMPIFPRAKEPTHPMRIRNQKINEIIHTYADGEKVVWLDFNQKFLLPNQNIPTTIMADLLHPTEKGYIIWAKELLPYLKNP